MDATLAAWLPCAPPSLRAAKGLCRACEAPWMSGRACEASQSRLSCAEFREAQSHCRELEQAEQIHAGTGMGMGMGMGTGTGIGGTMPTGSSTNNFEPKAESVGQTVLHLVWSCRGL
ncbi:hypothetical protein OH76DRAFT_1413679 [Lentinus brumalis]|uniref:Uncharacterized protein n=1 Tax=Lentinus brumalis TaxID=2498619 RepID=A0A371DXD2_9APHY|nr:hypothetical protein OH76DRAFT_1413679 [Polyporus brumalis]